MKNMVVKLAAISVRMMRLLLVCGLMNAGCASMMEPKSVPIAVRYYDVPNTVSSPVVVEAIETAFIRTMQTAPRVIEGDAPAVPPETPSDFTVGLRQVHLEKLGVFTIPQIDCPDSLLMIYGYGSGFDLILHRYAACVQPFVDGYRVTLVEAGIQRRTGMALQPAETAGSSNADVLFQIAEEFMEQVRHARLVQRSSFPKRAISEHARSIHLSPEPTSQSTMPHGTTTELPQTDGRGPVQHVPLVCLEPKYESAPVRSRSRGGLVVGTLRIGSMIVVEEPLDPAYFHVNSREGIDGWVDRSAVRRVPCPIG